MRLGRGRPSDGPRTWRAAVRHLGGRVVVVVGAGDAYEGGHGWSGGSPPDSVRVSVRHLVDGHELEVESGDDRDLPDDVAAFFLVGQWTSLVTRPDRVAFPLELRADRWTADVEVDGVAVPFTFVGDDTRWCASGRTADRQITVTSDGRPHTGLALATVDAKAVSGAAVPSA